MLPSSIKKTLEENHEIIVTSAKPLSGGSINQACKISSETSDYFLKWNNSAPADFFEKEAAGLKHLKSAGSSLRIPDVISAASPVGETPGYLLMEFINECGSGDSFRFGEELAKLHRTKNDQFGLHHDNYIGRLPQSNRQHSEWAEFFSEERIRPQLKLATDSGEIALGVAHKWDIIASRLDELLPSAQPSLIHGDLWGGNYLFDESGKAVLIDPAVYYGHPEMDLAFSKMFGGFSGEFYRGYESVTPLEPGFQKRIPIYNLYPLLVHVNLFGGHYSSQAVSFLKSY